MGANCCTRPDEEGIEIIRPEKAIISNFSRNNQKNNENFINDPFSYDSNQKENPNLYSQHNDFSNQEKEKEDQQKKNSNYEYSQISQKQEDINTPLNHSENQLQEKIQKNTINTNADQTGNEQEINTFEDFKKIENLNKNENITNIEDTKKIENLKKVDSVKRIDYAKKIEDVNKIEDMIKIEENNNPEKEPENKEKSELKIENKQEVTINNKNENNNKEILKKQNQTQILEQKQKQKNNNKDNNIIYSEIPNNYQPQQIYTTTKNIDNIYYSPAISKPIVYGSQSQIYPYISQTLPNDLYTENQKNIIQTEAIIQSDPDYLLNNATDINNINYYQTPSYETSQNILTNDQIISSNENYLVNGYTPYENIIQNDPLLYQPTSKVIYSSTQPLYNQSTEIPINLLADYELKNCYYDDTQLLNTQPYINDINNIYNTSTENYINYQTEPEIQYTQSPKKNEIIEYENPTNNYYYSQPTTPTRNNYEMITPETLDFQQKTPILKNKSTAHFSYDPMTFQQKEKKYDEDDFNLTLSNYNKSKLHDALSKKYNHNRTLSEMNNNYRYTKSLKSFTKEKSNKKPQLPKLSFKNIQQDGILSDEIPNNYNENFTFQKKLKIDRSRKLYENNSNNEIDYNIIEFYKNNVGQNTNFSPDMWKNFYPKNERFFLFNTSSGKKNQIIKKEEIDPKYPNEIPTYHGEINSQGEKHGYGKLTSLSYEKEGEWRNDKFTGWGREIRKNGEFFEGKFIDGEISGKGVYKNSYGDLYIGDFSHSIKHGEGELITSKIHYKGDFDNNRIHGIGRIEFLEGGNTFEGEFENNQINGNGIFKWQNGDMYEGEMKNGKMDGYGIFKSDNGFIYEGQFRNGVEDGHGKLVYPEGRVFEGNFKNGKPIKVNRKYGGYRK